MQTASDNGTYLYNCKVLIRVTRVLITSYFQLVRVIILLQYAFSFCSKSDHSNHFLGYIFLGFFVTCTVCPNKVYGIKKKKTDFFFVCVLFETRIYRLFFLHYTYERERSPYGQIFCYKQQTYMWYKLVQTLKWNFKYFISNSQNSWTSIDVKRVISPH